MSVEAADLALVCQLCGRQTETLVVIPEDASIAPRIRGKAKTCLSCHEKLVSDEWNLVCFADGRCLWIQARD